jgi:hypothetical protein
VGESLEKLNRLFGANINPSATAEKLTVSYGGLALGDMLYGMEYLDADRVEQAVGGIGLKERISGHRAQVGHPGPGVAGPGKGSARPWAWWASAFERREAAPRATGP